MELIFHLSDNLVTLQMINTEQEFAQWVDDRFYSSGHFYMERMLFDTVYSLDLKTPLTLVCAFSFF